MKEKFWEKVAKLIDVKSIVTIILTVIFGILALLGVITPEQFVDVFKTIIIFYFGTQAIKTANENTSNK
jgi:hypothetical protein